MTLLFTAIYYLCMILTVLAIDKNGALRYRELSNAGCEIFCEGELLKHVQMSKVLNSSVAFFQYKLKYAPSNVNHNFALILNETLSPNNETLLKFIEDNFEPSDAYVKWVPTDWHPVPAFASDIYDSNLRNWVLEMNTRWKYLGRQINEQVLSHNDLYSALYIPHPFIVPGGVFNDYYYWDSYWIVEGLLISDMFQTAKYIIKNFLYLVEIFGYVPNGGQKYLVGRSQPPFLIPMFNLYFTRTRSKAFLQDSINVLEKEFDFWIKNRSKEIVHDGINFVVFQYKSEIDSPRPERFYHDMEYANKALNKSKGRFYSNVRAAAESGWDFSSRWFLQNGSRTINITDINTDHIAPVCLNGFLGYNARLLSNFFDLLGNDQKSKKYARLSQSIGKTMDRLFWDEEEGIWLDYNLVTGKLQKGFYMSSLIPLWTDTYGEERDKSYVVQRVVNYIERYNISDYSGGMPTSLNNSHEQWDFPNGWAPLQHMAIFGLQRAKKYDERAGKLALKIARNWIINGFNTYLNSTPPSIYEKYDVVHAGNPGSGGEYLVQKGFGWTNGVAMKILNVYGHKIRIGDKSDPVSVIVGILLILSTTVAIINYLCRDNCSDNLSEERSDFLLEKMDDDELDV